MSDLERKALLERKILECVELANEIAGKKELLKSKQAAVLNMMQESREFSLVIPFGEHFNIKAEVKSSIKRTLDKEQLATDLKVSKSSVKTDHLVKWAEERRLTFEKLKEYYLEDPQLKVSITKKKKPKGRRKK